MDDYKESNAIFYYNEFALWRKEFPFDLDIGDNELTYIIFDGLLKNVINKEHLINALLNSIQYTNLPDNIWYNYKREMIMEWLMRGANLYRNQVETIVSNFSQVNHIFTKTEKGKNFILLCIYGKKEKYGEKIIGRIPSTDGLPEAFYRSFGTTKTLFNRGHN